MSANDTTDLPAEASPTPEDKPADQTAKTTSGRRSYKYDDPPIVFKDVDVSILAFYSIV